LDWRPSVLEAWTWQTVSVRRSAHIRDNSSGGPILFNALAEAKPVHKNHPNFASAIAFFSPQQSAVLSRGRSTFCFAGQTVWDVLVWNTALTVAFFRTIILYIGHARARAK